MAAARTEREFQTAAEQEGAPDPTDARRRHDLANALTNVEVAAAILAEDGLSAESRAALVRILESGIERLRTMLVCDGERPVPDAAEGPEE